MEKAVNLCDIGYRLVKTGRLEAAIASYPRVYVGSYFCDRYFLLTTQCVLDQLKKTGKQVTLVIPVPSETTAQPVKDMTAALLRKYKRLISEVVVNDLGMLCWVREHCDLPLILGRLFCKALRDPRYPDTTESYCVPEEQETLIRQFRCAGVETEGCFRRIGRASPALHYRLYIHAAPYYMSCMRQCFFASIYKKTNRKFIQNAPCRLECMQFRLKNNISGDAQIHRMGKGVFFVPDTPEIPAVENAILIEQPWEMW